ncbi:gamma-glutamylcyclotransferase family protein [Streptomyces sp. V4-01]|uniref:Gamma-glutamylcyclotransferase family protein n=1 Tax=Actinacidiphila polyblastidii TaxID=3110430 RepID=A0ABU7PF20_9ACTN|nr:gamma-glutamylcyclotransferase family protein [Streptomyces sp. V4-01]
MTAPRLPFFVYGTLLRGQRNHALLAGRVRSWTAAVLPGALLFDGPGYPFAVADPAGRGRVRGELVGIAEESYDLVLADLDRLETYVPGAPGNLYERVRRAVTGERGAQEAWVYLANEPLAAQLLAHGRRIDGGDWPASR